MARFKFRKRKRKKYDRTDADIIASKMLFDDRKAGREIPLAEYDRISDQLCGKSSRKIYDNEEKK